MTKRRELQPPPQGLCKHISSQPGARPRCPTSTQRGLVLPASLTKADRFWGAAASSSAVSAERAPPCPLSSVHRKGRGSPHYVHTQDKGARRRWAPLGRSRRRRTPFGFTSAPLTKAPTTAVCEFCPPWARLSASGPPPGPRGEMHLEKPRPNQPAVTCRVTAFCEVLRGDIANPWGPPIPHVVTAAGALGHKPRRAPNITLLLSPTLR